MALFAPNVNAFRRIILRHLAPINTQWGYDNRTAGLRVPISNAENRRVENRLAGADANPYLALAASLACGYLGMIEGLKPSEPVSGSAYDLPFGLPRSLEESVRLLRDCRPAHRPPGRALRAGLHGRQGKRARHVPAGHQLVGTRAPAAERVARPLSPTDFPKHHATTSTPYVADRTTAAWQQLDRQHYLHPFTDYKSLHAKGARVIVKAEGVYLYDSEGNRILDGMAGLWCVNVGYGRRELAEAAYRQMLELPYYNSFFQTAHPPAIELAKQLVDLTPPQFNRVFFTGSGSEGNDTVVRLVRRYWDLLGQPRAQGHHQPARTPTTAAPWRARAWAAWRSCTSRAACRSRTSSTLPSRTGTARAGTCRRRNSACKAARELERKIEELGAHRVAAFIGEPIQGAGGVIIPPDTYWPEIQRICDRYGILLVADEVICGFGRTGHWFGSNLYGIRPDLMTIAKGLSSGYLPIGGVMVADRVADVLIDKGGEFAHGYTYSGHPAACAVASVNLTHHPAGESRAAYPRRDRAVPCRKWREICASTRWWARRARSA